MQEDHISGMNPKSDSSVASEGGINIDTYMDPFFYRLMDIEERIQVLRQRLSGMRL